MQCEFDSTQLEWRIVNKNPFSFSSETKAGMVEEALRLAGTWQLANLRLQPDNVDYLVCPVESESQLRQVLPEGFSSCAIRAI